MAKIPKGFYTLTYRFRILDGDARVFEETKELYNRVVEFFLGLYFSSSAGRAASAGDGEAGDSGQGL